MREIIDLLKKKSAKKSEENEDIRISLALSNKINRLCEENLHSVGDNFTFEVRGARDLEYVVGIIDKPPLSTKYEVVQISERIFQAQLKVVEF